MPKKFDFEDDEFTKNAFKWMGIGIEFCLVVGGFAFLGYLLDSYLGDTSPGFLIFGFFIGFAYMMYTMIKRAGGIKW